MLDLNLDFDLLDYEEEDEDNKNENLLNDRDIETNDRDQSIEDKKIVKIESKTKSFRDFLLRQELLRAINDAGFESPSEVQNECIPQAMMGLDILCQAKSGMGKTCVFVLSTLQQLDVNDTNVSVLVICHTRELAFQISREYERFSKYMRINIGVFFGGISQRLDEQVLTMNKPHVVVTTTGRLNALIRSKKIDLRFVKYFIVDECDNMLGREDSLEDMVYINRHLSRDKQVMMFSATLNEITRISAKKFMHNPLEVVIGDDSKLVLHGLQQFYLELQEKAKLRKLYELLKTIEFKQTIIFVNTIQRCITLCDVLEKFGQPVICIHGSQSQELRLLGYQLIKTYKKRVLVTTKMFDRGIDFERVNLVINYDMPDNSDTYLHAVGRAGRFGTKGVAISFIANHEDNIIWRQVQTRFDIKLEELPENVVI